MFRVTPDDMTGGSIPRALVILAGPLVVQNVIHVANLIVDTFWLGRLGEDEVAAVGLNFPVISVVAAGITLVAIGTQITLAQRVGADEHRQARRLAVTGLVTAVLLGTVVATLVATAATPLMTLLAGEGPVASLAALYLWTVMLFYPFAYASDTLENAFVGWGDTKAALWINVVLVGTNVVLDPFLIFGWGPFPALGIQGAAIASGLGMVAGFALAVGLALGVRESFSIDRTSLRYDLGFAWEIITVGIPLCGQRLARDVVRVAIMGLVAVAGGAAGLAAFTVGERVASLAVVPALGLQQAAQSMIGQNLGADRPRRAYRTTIVGALIATVALSALGVIQWVFAGLIVDILVPDLTPEGRSLSVRFLEILAISYWAMGATFLLLAAFNGARRTRTSFVVDLLKYWGVRLPIAIVAIPATVTVGAFGMQLSPGLDLGVTAIFWAVTISNIVAFVGAGAYFVITTRRGMFSRAVETAAEAIADD